MKLNEKELHVLDWLSKGKKYDEIANLLEIKPNAVKQRCFIIKNKLGTSTLAGAVSLAFRKGLIS